MSETKSAPAETESVEAKGIIGAAQLLIRSGVLSFSGHGNASIRTDEAEMVLTSRSNLVGLDASGTARVTFEGEVRTGSVDAANLEIVEMHRGVYEVRPDVKAIVHTHSPNITSYALAHRPLPSRYESTIRFGIVDDIPVAPWGPRGSQMSVDYIVATLAAHPGTRAVLLANHGILTFGNSVDEAARMIIALEEAALAGIGAESLGGSKPFPDGALDEVRTRMTAFGLGAQVGSGSR